MKLHKALTFALLAPQWPTGTLWLVSGSMSTLMLPDAELFGGRQRHDYIRCANEAIKPIYPSAPAGMILKCQRI